MRAGESLDMDAFIRDLDRLGYSVQPLVQEAGEVSRRGGIVDVFPPTSDDPVRIEFWGDEIESIRYFAAVQPADAAHSR